jgi:hypothetical protein
MQIFFWFCEHLGKFWVYVKGNFEFLQFFEREKMKISFARSFFLVGGGGFVREMR